MPRWLGSPSAVPTPAAGLYAMVVNGAAAQGTFGDDDDDEDDDGSGAGESGDGAGKDGKKGKGSKGGKGGDGGDGGSGGDGKYRGKAKSKGKKQGEVRDATKKIQSKMRGRKARKEAAEMADATKKIQAGVRGRKARKNRGGTGLSGSGRSGGDRDGSNSVAGTRGTLQFWALRKGLPPKLADALDGMTDDEQSHVHGLGEEERMLFMDLYVRKGFTAAVSEGPKLGAGRGRDRGGSSKEGAVDGTAQDASADGGGGTDALGAEAEEVPTGEGNLHLESMGRRSIRTGAHEQALREVSVRDGRAGKAGDGKGADSKARRRASGRDAGGRKGRGRQMSSEGSGDDDAVGGAHGADGADDLHVKGDGGRLLGSSGADGRYGGTMSTAAERATCAACGGRLVNCAGEICSVSGSLHMMPGLPAQFTSSQQRHQIVDDGLRTYDYDMVCDVCGALASLCCNVRCAVTGSRHLFRPITQRMPPARPPTPPTPPVPEPEPQGDSGFAGWIEAMRTARSPSPEPPEGDRQSLPPQSDAEFAPQRVRERGPVFARVSTGTALS